MSSQKPSFRFEIDNFSERKDHIVSQIFVSGGCEWCLWVYPKGESLCDDNLSLFLCVANPLLLQPGWKRSVNYYFSLLNQSGKLLYRSAVACGPFSPKAYTWGYRRLLPLRKIQEKGFLEEDKLVIEVYTKIVDGEAVDINGFQVLTSQVTSVRKIFAEHPDLARYFKPMNQVVKTEYMNVLLGLVNTLDKPLKNISMNELRNAQSELNELSQEGFNLDWLITKFDMVYWEKMKSYDANGFRVLGLEERVKNLEQMESNLKRKLEVIELERKKAKDDEPRVEKLEERVKNLELIDSLKSKLEDVSLEKKKPYDADGSRVQELEESVTDLKMMVSDLKAKLDKNEAKSSDDEFLLVNEVA